MTMRRLLKWVIAFGIAGTGLLIAPAIWVHVDDSAVPPDPEVPAHVTVLSRDVQCGSGGCYRELVLVGTMGQSGLDLLSALELQVGSETANL